MADSYDRSENEGRGGSFMMGLLTGTVLGEPQRFANPWNRPRESVAIIRLRCPAFCKRTERGARSAEAPRHVHVISGSRCCPEENIASSPEHGEGERKLGTPAHVSAQYRRVEGTSCITDTIGNGINVPPPILGNRHRDKHSKRFCSHRSEIAECGSSSAIADLSG